MYWQPPKESELAALCLTVADVAPPPVDLWPDNIGPFEVFAQLVTQWRSAGFGRTGLDYNTIPFALRMNRVPRNEWPEYFELIRVMENAALDAMNED